MRNQPVYRLNPETLVWEEVKEFNYSKHTYYILAIFILTIFALHLCGYYKPKTIIETIYLPAERPLIMDSNNVKKKIEKLHIKYPKVVLAQCLLESGYFKSPLAKKNNNILGMQCALMRPTTSGKGEGIYAKYITWEDCLIDYALWQSYNISKIKNQDEYLALLATSYSKDKDYRETLQQMIKKL